MDDIDVNNLGAIAKVPVKVSVVLGKAKMTLSELLAMKEGSVLELDKAVGEDVDVYVNENLVAKGEVVIEDGQLGIVLTQILGDMDSQ